jgi:hypothetical protein
LGESLRAAVLAVGGSSSAAEANFDLTVGAAAVSIDVVAVIAPKSKALGISAYFKAERRSKVKVEAGLTRGAGIARRAAEASAAAGQASQLLGIPVGSNIAGRRGIGVKGGGGSGALAVDVD